MDRQMEWTKQALQIINKYICFYSRMSDTNHYIIASFIYQYFTIHGCSLTQQWLYIKQDMRIIAVTFKI